MSDAGPPLNPASPAFHAAALRNEAAAIQPVIERAKAPYTSKNELRDLAVAGLSALQAQYLELAAAAEQKAVEDAAATGLLTSPAGLIQL